MAINEEVRKAYFNALYNQQNGSNVSMKEFRNSFPNEYQVINAIYHKRVKVRECINAMKELSFDSVYWGCLTYGDSRDKNSIRYKRQQAQKHLNDIFLMWLMVEEYGEENGRYHIHFIGVFKEGKTFEDYFKWQDREQIEKVKSVKKVARYLCDYMTKQVPRIRRSKTLIKCVEHYKKSKYYSAIGFGQSLGEKHRRMAFSELVFAEADF